jgi:transposase, IS30 family
MNTYTQLSQDERYYISAQRTRKVSFSQIARDLGRSTSTITREFKRNLRPSGRYEAFVAHSYATARRRRSRRKSHFTKECWMLIYSLLEEKLSPEQISDYLSAKGLFTISFQSIYRVIRIDRRRGGSLFKDLRIMPKQRRKRYGSLDSRGVLRGKRSISERPAYINNRSEFGHWEADTVMGKDKHQCFLTIVERKSGLNRIVKLQNRTAKNVIVALIAIISAEPDKFKSITFDNGTEFHSYKILEDIFGIICYFANPHHPWERGCNENFNGLLRQYFPKGSSLNHIGARKTNFVSEQLNNRPRKRLGFKSPKEVFYAHP